MPEGDGGSETPAGPKGSTGLGKVARYAWGDDYHRVMKERMKALVEGLARHLDLPIRARWYVDDGPMLDRAAAQRAGLGWFGKNTNILSPSHGSWIFLGQMVTDLEMAPDPASKKTCGSCVRCVDSCPTGAIVAPYVIDNTRCISYLTIENRGPIPRELRPLMFDWIFGCDICQDVCPVNRKAAPTEEPAFQKTSLTTVDLEAILEITEDAFRVRFRNSPIKRAKLVGLQRNACVALGNSGDPPQCPSWPVPSRLESHWSADTPPGLSESSGEGRLPEPFMRPCYWSKTPRCCRRYLRLWKRPQVDRLPLGQGPQAALPRVNPRKLRGAPIPFRLRQRRPNPDSKVRE